MIRIDVHEVHIHHVANEPKFMSMLADLKATLHRIEHNMAVTLQDILNQLTDVKTTAAATKDVADSIVVAIDGLNALVADLKRQIEQGSVTNLDEVKQRLDDITSAIEATKTELAQAAATIPPA